VRVGTAPSPRRVDRVQMSRRVAIPTTHPSEHSTQPRRNQAEENKENVRKLKKEVEPVLVVTYVRGCS